MRIIHRVDYGAHTNDLFWKSKTLKLFDLVEHKTAQVLYKARNYLLPRNIQRMFHEREQGYDLREIKSKGWQSSHNKEKFLYHHLWSKTVE